MKYRKKPTLTEATQWLGNGDHPQDRSVPIDTQDPSGQGRLTEGQIVKYFRSLNIPEGRFCSNCGNIMQKHGLLDGLNGEEIICPGDYIVVDRKGRYYRVPGGEFEAQYEPYNTPQ